MSVDWERYQKCRVCSALLGKPCISEHRAVPTDAGTRYDPVFRFRPHSTRKLTAAAARAGGDHG